MIQKVVRDLHGHIMWVRRHPELSPLTYTQWYEGKNMQSGCIRIGIKVFQAPFTVALEETNDIT